MTIGAMREMQAPAKHDDDKGAKLYEHQPDNNISPSKDK